MKMMTKMLSKVSPNATQFVYYCSGAYRLDADGGIQFEVLVEDGDEDEEDEVIEGEDGAQRLLDIVRSKSRHNFIDMERYN